MRSARVIEYIRRTIASGALGPGDRITELDISGKLGISRSPVREALATLAQEGVVTLIPYRGAIVSTVDADRFAALAEFRLLLEEFALGHFIRSASQLDVARLDREIAKIRKHARAGRAGAALEADLHLHQVIVAHAGNPFLSRAYTELMGHLRLYATLTTTDTYASLEELADENERWVEAVRRGDAASALAIMRAHIELGFDEALARLRRAEAARSAPPARGPAKKTYVADFTKAAP